MAQEYVDTKIQADKVVLFIKASCPYCVLAQNVLTKYNFKQGKLEIHDITGHTDMGAIQEYLRNKTGAKTVSSFSSNHFLETFSFLLISNLERWFSSSFGEMCRRRRMLHRAFRLFLNNADSVLKRVNCRCPLMGGGNPGQR